MEKAIIVSDFDGTITKEDTLYSFFKTCANPSWLEIEDMWAKGKIGSSECLKRQFELVDDLSEDLIDNFISKIELDCYFSEFIHKNTFDFIVVSDGVDYFIDKVFQNNGIKNVQIISNHAEFINNKFTLSFPNKNSFCKNNSGTCKCSVISELRKKYDKVIYIGDGQSDFCVSNKADILFAKNNLLNYCKKNNINYKEFENFKALIDFIQVL